MQAHGKAPAKINLHLKVGGRRPDGFHDIESLFCALGFGDTVYAETRDTQANSGFPAEAPPLGALEICMNWQFAPAPSLPPEKNIISRAVSLFRDRTGFDLGLKITVEKHIPLGGGLGGGSSDAAATLMVLNEIASSYGKAMDYANLVELGASLGSDVPFFIRKQPADGYSAWVTGRGEQVQRLEVPESVRKLSVVLVNPGFSSDTAGAYRLLDSFRGEHAPALPINSEFLRESFAKPPRDWPFTNDFLPVFTENAGKNTVPGGTGAVYQQIISSLREWGADFAGLSGSGSTCFGVFSEAEKAESAKEFHLKHHPFVINTFFACVSGNTIVQLGADRDRRGP